jgi:hypothetical protein
MIMSERGACGLIGTTPDQPAPRASRYASPTTDAAEATSQDMNRSQSGKQLGEGLKRRAEFWSRG